MNSDGLEDGHDLNVFDKITVVNSLVSAVGMQSTSEGSVCGQHRSCDSESCVTHGESMSMVMRVGEVLDMGGWRWMLKGSTVQCTFVDSRSICSMPTQ